MRTCSISTCHRKLIYMDQMSALGGGLTAISQSQWDSTTLSKFEKNFYQEHPGVSALSSIDVEAFRASKQVCHPLITIKDYRIPCLRIPHYTKFSLVVVLHYLICLGGVSSLVSWVVSSLSKSNGSSTTIRLKISTADQCHGDLSPQTRAHLRGGLLPRLHPQARTRALTQRMVICPHTQPIDLAGWLWAGCGEGDRAAWWSGSTGRMRARRPCRARCLRRAPRRMRGRPNARDLVRFALRPRSLQNRGGFFPSQNPVYYCGHRPPHSAGS